MSDEDDDDEEADGAEVAPGAGAADAVDAAATAWRDSNCSLMPPCARFSTQLAAALHAFSTTSSHPAITLTEGKSLWGVRCGV